MSKQKHEIALPSDTEFLTTREIPALIAEALHPQPEHDIREVTYLTKQAKPNAEGETAKWNGWPIDDDDRALLNGFWKHLPQLEFPIAEDEWKPYAEAFEQRGGVLDWELIPAIRSASLNAAVLRHAAEEEHRNFLRAAILRDEVKQLSPASHIPSTIYLENGKVAVEELRKYVAQFHIDISVAEMDALRTEFAKQSDMPEQNHETGLTKREQQIQAIEKEVKILQFTATAIPTGGKRRLKSICKQNHTALFGAGDDPFLDAWKEAVKQGRIKMAKHNTYARK